VDPDLHLAAAERELDLFADALADADLTRTVPTCPEWTLRDLASHVGDFTGFWTHVICEATGAEKPEFPRAPAEGDLATWFRADASRLVAALASLPPEAHVWTWDPDDETAAFARRRCAHEAAIHRIDAQLTVGTPEPVEGQLAADGIDEIFVMLKAFNPGTATAGDPGPTMHLHSTDRDDDLVITLAEGGPLLSTGHPDDADLTVQASTSDLELLLYNRPTQGRLTKTGDPTVLDGWYEVFRFGG
jgi:uncharacterized protein (TIGR03083 family)